MVVGANPSTVNWMDIFSHTFVVKIVEKEAGDGPFLCHSRHEAKTGK